ncbi:hypothetical protein CLOSYM_02753 [[Clostridium] symbiosum ATCC 14940]|uniref:Uncharacterized protein n=1 Tax=[Clostridium] symbiosum ATCC 14940 TaxID=411472 RepID=A0ABC9TWL5_CLOSY|nr:hypothetical protein CLOSYM_02758 [[Clostridium] symbiosum ATCC 14940]ERI76218.1 hypothetical protein CLOSYM_02753 [[Clostridium] symbiosum ATCC 14940]
MQVNPHIDDVFFSRLNPSFSSCLHPLSKNHRQPQLISVMCRITPYGNGHRKGD